jgi:integrase
MPQLLLLGSGSVEADVPFLERQRDHEALLDGYLTTLLTRNYSTATRDTEGWFLKGWFAGQAIRDRTHPDGQRQLLLWEAMRPGIGRQLIVAFSKGLVLTGLKPRTVHSYLGILRRFFAYILEYPYIPSSIGVQQSELSPRPLISKYGSIEQPVLEYDYPAHVIDQEDEGFVLTGESLIEFYEFIRLRYIPHAQKRFAAARDYTMVVVAADSGLRADEIRNLDLKGAHRDVFYERNRLQTRHGKATRGSGKRIRKTLFTPFAQATVKVFAAEIRPNYLNAASHAALFLSEKGQRMSYNTMWHGLHSIATAAREAGIELPARFGWHSLRKSFATNFMEAHPDQVWVLMDMLGHLNPSVIHRYVKHSRAYYESAIDRVLDDLIPLAPNEESRHGNHVELEEVARSEPRHLPTVGASTSDC